LTHSKTTDIMPLRVSFELQLKGINYIVTTKLTT